MLLTWARRISSTRLRKSLSSNCCAGGEVCLPFRSVIPVLAFLAWVFCVFHYFLPIKLGLSLADQLFSSFLFVSYLILILSWEFSGPILAAALTGLSALIVFYLALATKEPWLLIQGLVYALLYLGIASFLFEIQKKVNDKRLLKEKLEEETLLVRDDFIKNQDLEKAYQKRIDRFLDLHQFAETLKGIPTLSEAANRVVDEAHSLVPYAEECVLYLVNNYNQKLEILASNRALTLQPSDPDGSPFDQWVMKRSRPLIIEDSMNDFRFSTFRRDPTLKLRSVCACPLMTENKVLGVLRVSSRAPLVFSSDDLHSLDIISGLGAVTLRNRLLYDRMEELAIRDSLTGLYLNRYFQERLQEELARSGLSAGGGKATVFSVALLDVDHFKNYNDEFGHLAGDHVLKAIAKVMTRFLEPADIGARYGGEEFALLLPGKDKQSATNTSELIRKEIQGTKLVIRRAERTVTASIGVATYPDDGQSVEELLRFADKCLYQAKNQGRNRVCGNT